MPPNPDRGSDMGAAIYARFSSDLQTEKSIEDQVARCREIARAQGYQVAEVFSDHALSGASTANRPGVQNLMAAVAAGRIAVIVTESLDRLSRDQADLALIHRQCKMHRVRLITANDGEIGDGAQGILQIGMRGMFGAIYLADLADKTRRGQLGVARSGRIPGGQCYGYRVVEGEQRGLREIDPDQADVVRRIYESYAAGDSPRAIAKALNREGVSGPRGSQWGVTAILGNPKRLNGILCNPLYNGELVFNRQHKVKNPETGKCRMVPNPESEWIRKPMEHLRIVPAELWEAVQIRRRNAGGVKPAYSRRPSRVLAGLVKCGCCGGPYRTVAQKHRYGCANRRDKGTCSNSRTILAEALEERVFAGLRDNLLAPAAIEYAVACYHERMEELEAGKVKRRTAIERQLTRHRNTVTMARDYLRRGETPPAWLFDGATEAEQEIARLEAELETIDDPQVVRIHPQAARQYRRYVEELNDALLRPDTMSARRDAVTAIRDLITAIRVSPGGAAEHVTVEIEGDLAALLEVQESGRGVVKMGAGVGFEPTTFRL